MAYLTDLQHNTVREKWAKDLSTRFESVGLDKTDMKAAIIALDAYVEDNAVAINNTLPLAAQTTLTKSQKAELFMIVLAERYKVGA